MPHVQQSMSPVFPWCRVVTLGTLACLLAASGGCKSRGFNSNEENSVRALDRRGISDCVRTENDPVAVLGNSGALANEILAANTEPLRFVAQACPPRIPTLQDTPLMASNVSVVPGSRDLVAVAYRAVPPKDTPLNSAVHFKGAVALYEFSKERVDKNNETKERVLLNDEALLAIPNVAIADIDLRGDTLFLAGSRLKKSSPKAKETTSREAVVGWTRLRRQEGKLTFSHDPVWRVVPESQSVNTLVAKRKRLFLGLGGSREGLVAYHRDRIERPLAVGENEVLSSQEVAWQPEKPFAFQTYALDGSRVGRFVVVARRDEATQHSGITVVTNRGEVNGRESTLDFNDSISRMSLQFGRRVTSVAAGGAGVRFVCTATGKEVGAILPDRGKWSTATSVATKRGLVFVATGFAGMEIYAVRQEGRGGDGCAERKAVRVHSYRFQDAAAKKDPRAFVVRDLMVRGPYLFVTMGYGGLRVFRFDALGRLAHTAMQKNTLNLQSLDALEAVDAPILDFDPHDADAFDVEENDDAPF